MGKITGHCEECGKVIEYWPSQQRRFCSLTCRGTFQGREQWAGRQHKPTKPRRGIEMPCETCGKPVYTTVSQRAQGKGRFCSRACQYVAQTKTPVIKPCAGCGKELRLKPSQAHVQYCSKQCEALAKIKRPTGETHNGKPKRRDQQGYVLVWQPEHPNKLYKGWQYEHRLVAEQVLGSYLSSDLHVHHINGIKDDNRPENLEVMDADQHAALSSTEYRDHVRQSLAEIQELRSQLAEYRRRYGPLDKDI